MLAPEMNGTANSVIHGRMRNNRPLRKTLMPYRDNRVNDNRWEGIDEFVAVAECAHFTAAAQRLGVSSSHVSRQIARLEERLQTRLLYRSTRRVALTEAGQTFLQHCQRLQDGRDEAWRAMSDLTGEPKGLLRLTCAVAYGERFIVPLVTRFMGLYPQLRVEIELSNRTLDLLQKAWTWPSAWDACRTRDWWQPGWRRGECSCALHRTTWRAMAGPTVCRS